MRKPTRRALLIGSVGAAIGAERALFDGKSFQSFRTPTGATNPSVSWRIVDGKIASIPASRRQCDLWTVEEYQSFDLSFHWKVERGGNSGVKYLIQAMAVDQLKDEGGPFVHETSLGFEFQLVDDRSPAGADSPLHVSGALYNYLPPIERAAKEAGEWNTGRLVVNGDNVEHWINERRVLAFGLRSPELIAALRAKSLNSARMLERLEKRRTAIAFQHHHSLVEFRAIRIKTL